MLCVCRCVGYIKREVQAPDGRYVSRGCSQSFAKAGYATIKRNLSVRHKSRSFDHRDFDKEELSKLFENSQSSHETCLKLCADASSYDAFRRVILRFRFWVTPLHDSQHKIELSRNVKFEAFEVGQRFKARVFFKFVAPFDLLPLAQEFLPPIKELLTKGDYVVATNIIQSLNLRDHFTIHETVVPCVLSGELFSAFRYVKSHSALRPAVFDVLKQLCSSNECIVDYMRVHRIHRSFLSQIPKVTPKRVAELAKKFAEETCSSGVADDEDFYVDEFNQVKDKGVFHWLFGLRKQQLIYEQDFIDHVKLAIDSDKDSLEYFLKLLRDQGEYVLAMNFVDGTIPSEPSEVKEQENLLQLPQKLQDNLVLVDSDKTMQEMWGVLENVYRVNSMENRETLVAVDTEWHPFSASKASPTRLSVMQISLRDYVFVIDALALTTEHWQQLIEKLFSNARYRKVGFSLESDLAMVLGSVPKSVSVSELSNTCCIRNFLSQLQNCNLSLDITLKECNSSLSSLCQLLLGKPLLKKAQLSNWNRRPLSDYQLNYAALDAFVLLEIYERLRQKCFDLGFDFTDAVSQASISWQKALAKRRHKHCLASVELECTTSVVQDDNINNDVPEEDFQDTASITNTATDKYDDLWFLERKRELFELLQRGLKLNFKKSQLQSAELLPPKRCRPGQLTLAFDKLLMRCGPLARNVGFVSHVVHISRDRSELSQFVGKKSTFVVTKGTSLGPILGSMPSNAVLLAYDENSQPYRNLFSWVQTLNVDISFEDLFARCSVCSSTDFSALSSDDFQQLRATYFEATERARKEKTSVWLWGRPRHFRRLYMRVGPGLEVAELGSNSFFIIDVPKESFAHRLKQFDFKEMPPVLQLYNFNENIVQNTPNFRLCRRCGKVQTEKVSVKTYLSELTTMLNKLRKRPI